MNTTVISGSPHLKIIEPERPNFEVVKAIPDGMAPQIEIAVRDFMVSSHLPQGVDPNGFYKQTLQAIAAASYLGQSGDLWLGISNGRLWTYILAHIGNDFDGRLAYTVSQAWVRQDQRGKPWVKWAWKKVRDRAKNCFCGHLVILSSRQNDKAYCRFLGKGFHYYASILKEEL